MSDRQGDAVRGGRAISFQFNGRPVSAIAGDTVASALYASGVRVFSRSFKYHRPRGLLCGSGRCPNCIMNVDGVPNVRTCTEPARDGMKVRTQNSWPSVNRDLFSSIRLFDFLLPIGFYYKIFRTPRSWRLADRVIRRLAGLGKIGAAADVHSEHVYLSCDIAVVGGGVSGMRAAMTAADAGLDVFLIEEEPELGGQLRFQRTLSREPEGDSAAVGFELARRLAANVRERANIRVFLRALAFGAYEGGLLAVRQENRLVHVRAKQTIVATGVFGYPETFERNDLPGIMLAGAARRLTQLYGIPPARTAVICTSSDEGYALALDLSDAGVKVEALADLRSGVNSRCVEEVRRRGIRILEGHRILAAEGRGRVRGAVLEPVDSRSRTRVPCACIILDTKRAPNAELLRQAGVPFVYDEASGRMHPGGSAPGVYAAGCVTGTDDLDVAMLQGAVAGRKAALTLGASVSESDIEAEEQKIREYRSGITTGRTQPELLGDGHSQFVCFCEDVKQKDLTRAIAEGFSELEMLKRYSTTSMGPCQGRMCLMNASAVCASRTGRTLEQTGATTARPPVMPVSLGVLAGPEHEPVKLTPMHYRHVALGAKQLDMGPWKRPHTYTTQEEEWRAVRQRVGLIDVSTLGRIELKGKDGGRLLDKVYTHVFSSLDRGRVRYGVICNDEGVILDDGTVSRLAEDHFFITTTTGNIDFVETWLDWSAQGTGWCAHVTNVTADYGAVNLAGPRARDTLRKLTSIDLSPHSFKYMMCTQAEVAGVRCILLRIGFVGETGWEIHFPAAYGEYMWDRIMAAGQEFDIRPFGVETQRILRLEKKHLIVGQDTDALSTPIDADMAWCIKPEKPDFIGKAGLRYLGNRRGEQKLVGFTSESKSPIPEGSVVVDGGKPAGRVTSCRISPHLGKCIGMAWVPASQAADGAEIQIRWSGAAVRARVVSQPFYDAEGSRLRA